MYFCKLSRYLQIGIPDNFFGNCSSITICLEIWQLSFGLKLCNFFNWALMQLLCKLISWTTFLEDVVPQDIFSNFANCCVIYLFFLANCRERQFFPNVFFQILLLIVLPDQLFCQVAVVWKGGKYFEKRKEKKEKIRGNRNIFSGGEKIGKKWKNWKIQAWQLNYWKSSLE